MSEPKCEWIYFMFSKKIDRDLSIHIHLIPLFGQIEHESLGYTLFYRFYFSIFRQTSGDQKVFHELMF